MEADVAQKLAEGGVIFRQGRLEVLHQFRQQCSVLLFLSGTMLMVLQLRSFSEGRFLGIGPVARTIVMAFSLGLGSLFDYTLFDSRCPSTTLVESIG